MVLDELVFKTGLVRNIATFPNRLWYWYSIESCIDSDFNGTLFPSSGIGVYVLGYYQVWPQFRGVIEVSSFIVFFCRFLFVLVDL